MKAERSIVIEVTRGAQVESRHQVDVVVSDSDGAVLKAFGDAERSIFPRSAIKALQALPLVESGAAEAFGFEPQHLSLACASHLGETIHTDTAGEMLAAAGLDATCLECGVQFPAHPRDIRNLALKGIEAGPVHNNCSGKHSGFLASAVHQGLKTENYVSFSHPVQREIAAVLEEVTGSAHREENHGIDGCSIPTYAIPLKSLATAFARFGTGRDNSALRSQAMLNLRDACMAHPEMVGGTDAFDTLIMTAMQGRLFTKTGAEGVFTAAIPELGLGFALKCLDGTTRAAEVACAATALDLFLESDSELSQTELTTLKRLTNPSVKSRRGAIAGEVRIAS